MVEIIRFVLGGMVVASFVAIGVYVLVGAVITVSTLVGTVRRDRSADELDQFLTEILGPRDPAMAPEPKARSARSR
jgi:hypothetical protein